MKIRAPRKPAWGAICADLIIGFGSVRKVVVTVCKFIACRDNLQEFRTEIRESVNYSANFIAACKLRKRNIYQSRCRVEPTVRLEFCFGAIGILVILATHRAR